MVWIKGVPRLAALSAALVIGALSPAGAQQPSPDALQTARAACAADLQQFCSGVQPGGGRILACLKDHRDQVSAGCRQAVKSALQGSGGGAGAPSPGDATSSAPTPAPAAPAAPAGTRSEAAPGAASPQPVAHADSGAAHYFTLKLTRAIQKNVDHDETIYTMLAPADWTLNGGFTSNPDSGSCFSDMIQVKGAIKNSDGTVGMAVIPQSTFRYADDAAFRQHLEQADRFDEKFKLKGCPIKAPMHAADFLRESLIWKFHKEKPQITAEPFPELEQLVRRQLGLNAQAGNGTTRVEATRVRVSTTNEKGAAVDEWWSGVIVVRAVPGAGRGMGYDWHIEQTTAFQAPKGQLDGYDKLQRVMATSIRLDPQFLSWSSGLINKTYTAWAQEKAKQNKIIVEFQQHVVDTLNEVNANRERGANQAAFGADQLVRGVQTFHDPSTGRNVELSNLYDHAWSNGNDQYIVTDDPNFNPNGHVNGDWGELQLVRPQP